MTLEEVRKCEDAIVEAKTKYTEYTTLQKDDKKLTGFMTDELDELKKKWDPK
jgi:DNA gyrase subunit A